MNDILRPLLLQHEGLKLKAYKDTMGIWTIGIGHNIFGNRTSATAVKLNLNEHSEITESEAWAIWRDDVSHVMFELRNFHWFYDLTEIRQAAIVDMLFNLGLRTFLTFHKFLDAMEKEDYERASIEMLASVWASQVGQRAHTLAFMIETGHLVA